MRLPGGAARLPGRSGLLRMAPRVNPRRMAVSASLQLRLTTDMALVLVTAAAVFAWHRARRHRRHMRL